MNIVLALNLFRWRIGTFDVRITIDPECADAAQPVIDRGVKRITRGWVRHMAS